MLIVVPGVVTVTAPGVRVVELVATSVVTVVVGVKVDVSVVVDAEVVVDTVVVLVTLVSVDMTGKMVVSVDMTDKMVVSVETTDKTVVVSVIIDVSLAIEVSVDWASIFSEIASILLTKKYFSKFNKFLFKLKKLLKPKTIIKNFR